MSRKYTGPEVVVRFGGVSIKYGGCDVYATDEELPELIRRLQAHLPKPDPAADERAFLQAHAAEARRMLEELPAGSLSRFSFQSIAEDFERQLAELDNPKRKARRG